MQTSRCFASRLLFATIVVLLSLPAAAQAPAPPIQGKHQQERFVKQEVMIPMRDGVHLQTVIFTPKQSSGPLPILLRRTPYGVSESERRLDSGIYEDLTADGYKSRMCLTITVASACGEFPTRDGW